MKQYVDFAYVIVIHVTLNSQRVKINFSININFFSVDHKFQDWEVTRNH